MPPTDRPAWADWPEEPWAVFTISALPTNQQKIRALIRAVACVNALAGIRNPAALPELVEAAQRLRNGLGLVEYDEALIHLMYDFDAALARLSAEPEEAET